jgi:hypothetical protein
MYRKQPFTKATTIEEDLAWIIAFTHTSSKLETPRGIST